MLLKRRYFVLIVRLLLFSSVKAIYNFPSFGWIHKQNLTKVRNGLHLTSASKNSIGQETDKFFKFKEYGKQKFENNFYDFEPKPLKNQESEDFYVKTEKYNLQENKKEQNIEELKHLTVQEPEGSHIGSENEHHRGQEVEEINFEAKPDALHTDPKNEHHRGQEIEEINFGQKPDAFHIDPENEHHRGQEIEEINFGQKPNAVHSDPENEHHRGQEIEEINFGQKPDAFHIDPENEHHRGQEVEEINFEAKPDAFHSDPENEHHRGQEIEEINFEAKPDTLHTDPKNEHHIGQEIEEINFGQKPDAFHIDPENEHHRGQEIEKINFGQKPNAVHSDPENEHHRGQEIEEINFGQKPDAFHIDPENEHHRGQEIEEINFGQKPDAFHSDPENEHHRGQEVEEINFEAKPDALHTDPKNEHHRGQEIEEINFGQKPDAFHIDPENEHHRGQEIEEINFGQKPNAVHSDPKNEHHRGQEIEEINFGQKPDAFHIDPENGHRRQDVIKTDFGTSTTSLEKEVSHFSHVKFTDHGNLMDLFTPEAEVTVFADCLTEPEIPANSILRYKSNREIEISCQAGFMFSENVEKVKLKCEGHKWVPSVEAMPKCTPNCEPPCLNNGVCVRNQCICPENFEGPQCRFKRKSCTSKPPLPENSFANCNDSICIIKCFDNYTFPDNTTGTFLVCHQGQWILNRTDWNFLPDCNALCEPPCINGGKCSDFNKCQCPRQFVGSQCQYELAVCDAKKLNFNGYYTCRGKKDQITCTLSCPEGYDTDIPLAKEYICQYSDGTYSPQPVPKCLYEKNAEVIKSDNSSLIIHGGFGDFEKNEVPFHPTLDSAAECFSWNKFHYKNFDGKIFSFDGDCSYILAEDIVENTFRIVIKSPKCESCSRSLKLYYQDQEYKIQPSDETHSVTLNGDVIPIPSQSTDFLVVKKGSRTSITLLSIDVTLNWDAKGYVWVTVYENMWNKTGGLCGNFNKNPNDDFFTPDGTHAWNLQIFVQSWLDDVFECVKPADVKNNYKNERAVDYCRTVFTNFHFEKCYNSGLFKAYEEACIWDASRCGKSCACATISEAVKNCKNYLVSKGHPDSTSDWREITDCHFNCPPGKIYSSCGPFLEKSCGSFGMDENLIKYSECVEGCFCPEGLFRFNDSCVHKEYCPCKWRNKFYSGGEKIMNNCNTCICRYGEWECTDLKCPARCSVTGSSHYLTFDGKRYDFEGQCTYYLLKSENYTIESENVQCDGNIASEIFGSYFFKSSTCSKVIKIRYGKDEIKLMRNKQVLVNEIEVPLLPLEIEGIVIRLTYWHVIVKLLDNVEVWWDGNTNVFIDLPANYAQTMGGLCGTFNDNQKDDFLTPEGDIEQTVASFAEKWRTDEACSQIVGPHKPHPWYSDIECKEIAEKHCQALKGDTFKDCHAYVDVEPYYKNCLYDVCFCQKELKYCFCSVFAEYAMECARQFQELPWRNEIRTCGMHCPQGQIYQPCGDSCSRSCQDISMLKGSCEKKCAEGCSCSDGLVLDSRGQCIPVSNCPCFYQNLKYKPNYEVMMESHSGPQICICQNALWSCRPATNLEQAQNFKNSDLCNSSLHEEYTNCQPAELKTCKNMHEKPKKSTRICFPGCVCQKGFVWDSIGKICVNANECPCHHGGRSYSDGEKIQQDCNFCTCKNGKWSCTERECHSVCKVWGDSHFRTFDGRVYDFQGSCDFVLASGVISQYESFVITLQIVPCGSTGLSCPKSVILTVGSPQTEEKVVFKKQDQSLIPRNLERILIREVGLFIFAEVFDLGITVQWDKGARVYVKADSRWKNKVKGLCGNFNNNDLDDFKTPFSGEMNEISPVVFAESWQLQTACPESTPIIDTCERRPHRKAWAFKKCSVLNSEVFESCHSEVPPQPFLERCITDTCGCDEGGDCECLCTAIAAYADECTLRGVPIKWRTQHLCPLQCEGNSIYSPCVSPCPPKSCANQFQHFALLQICNEETCVEGCERQHCPFGEVFADSSSNLCIPITSCKTVCLKVNNVTYLEGDLMESDNCHSCYCSHHKRVCSGKRCLEVSSDSPPVNSTCPEGQIQDKCIVNCNYVCHNLIESYDTELQCSKSDNCIFGCREIDLKCSPGMFLRDEHTCVQKKDCPCRSLSGLLLKPGEVIQESECEKCQCINNEYECINVCTEPSLALTTPLNNYTRIQSKGTQKWDYFQEGNVTLILHTTVTPFFSCPDDAYVSLIDKSTRFSASSYLNETILHVFGQPSLNESWTTDRDDLEQYLQVDLGKVETIYAVNVFGYSGNYVSRYHLLYSLNGNTFSKVKNQYGEEGIFGGLSDDIHSVKEVLSNPVEARYIRFNPIQWHGQISMRVDVLGCKKQLISTTTHPSATACNESLAIKQKEIPGLKVSVTSSKPNLGSDFIGFNNEKGWQPLTNTNSEFVQLDFNDDVIVTGITTKGVSRSNEIKSSVEESWVEKYKVQYSYDGISWNPILDEFGNEIIFTGNSDSKTEKKNFFKSPIEAKLIKILPVKWHENIALRLDLMGCYKPIPVLKSEKDFSTLLDVDCNVCPGPLINKYCECGDLKWWNGENCVDRSECPCFVGLISYPVGTSFKTEKCEECICSINGVPHCTPKLCEDCPQGLLKVLTPLCGCLCKPCEENTRLCPSSNICLNESAWCNGIKDCPDDEINCTSSTTAGAPASSCVVSCPPGYKVLYRNKIPGPSEADDVRPTTKVKNIKSKQSVKTYRKTKKNQKAEKFTDCPSYICLPVKEIMPTECPPPKCPLDYLIVKKTFEASTGSCPLYACQPVIHSANCTVTSKNIKTFDGVQYKYEICDHVLVTHDSGLWNVTMLKNCTYASSCSSVLLINHGSHLIEIHSQNLLVIIDSFPYADDQLESLNSKMSDFSFNPLGKALFFTSEIFGFDILYDRNGNFEIKVPSSIKEHVSGLCGLYNGQSNDDKTKPDGDLAKLTLEFGDAWFNPGGNRCVETVCPIVMQNTALEICLKLKESPFNLCFEEANIELCIESTCDCLKSNKSQEECRCEVLSDFSDKCKNPNLFGWRVEHNCPSLCPPHLVYYDCYPYVCQPTCGNEECAEPAVKCYSGCFCPDGLVKKGNQCIKLEECRDCVCSGMGDSTYLTFDGGVTFNGNCTYLATREKNYHDIPSFQIFISNRICDGSDYMTCTEKVEVKVPEHSIQIVAVPEIEESVMILVDGINENVQKTGQLDKGWAKIAFNAETSLVSVELPQEHVNVYYFYKRFAFTISLPSHFYSDKVEGLCGSCNQRIIEPEEMDNPEVWQVKKDESCLIEPPVSCTPSAQNKDICLLMNSTQVFGQCLAFVDPTLFIDQCLTLACLNEQICRSLEAFAQACRDAGVCVNWRSDDLCPFKCPSDLEYQACGCFKTCENYDEMTSLCKTSPIEGCFCPNSEILMNGTCKPKKYCEFCDENGQHYEDELWQPDKCTNCSCKNHVVTCDRTECPEIEIKCNEDEIIVKEQSDYECCEKVKCACKHRDQCEKIEIPNDLAPGIELIVNETGCCPRAELKCRLENCPEPKPCRLHYVQKVMYTSECCPNYFCEKADDVCVYEFGGDSSDEKSRLKRSQRLEVVKEVGEHWSDGPCKICVCVKKDGVVEVECSITYCPDLKDHEDFEEYDIEQMHSPDRCCPLVVRKSCKHNGLLYKVGETWTPDENNPCESVKCSDWGDGQIKKETRLEVCNKNCEFGWKYNHSENTCCGQCVQVGCVIGEKIYEEGETWLSEDKCLNITCSKNNGVFIVTSETEKCPSVEDCPAEDIYEDGCCLKCKIRTEEKMICSPQFLPPEHTVNLIKFKKGKHGECHNVHPIRNFTQCAGNCDSFTVFKPETWSHESVCKCCKPQEYSLINVELKCQAGKDLIKTVALPSKCSCMPCGG